MTINGKEICPDEMSEDVISSWIIDHDDEVEPEPDLDVVWIEEE